MIFSREQVAPDESALLSEALDTSHALGAVLAEMTELIDVVVGDVDRANRTAAVDRYASALAIWQARAHVDELGDGITRIRRLDDDLWLTLRRADDRTLRRTDGVVTALGDTYVRRLSVSLDRTCAIARTMSADGGDVFDRAKDFAHSTREARASLHGLVRELDRNLRFSAGDVYARSVAGPSRRLVEWAVAMVPVDQRGRYREEFQSELYEFRDSGKRKQIALAVRLLVGTIGLRRALSRNARDKTSEERTR